MVSARRVAVALLAFAGCGFPSLATTGDAGSNNVIDGRGRDGANADAQLCFGDATVNVCFAQPLDGMIHFAAMTSINTDSSPMCGTVMVGPDACILSAGTITLDSTATVTATGSRALVLVGGTTVSIAGTLDAGSYANGPAGAAADPGTCVPAADATGAGGGAGGSFGSVGGNGGNDSGGTGGANAASYASLSLRGGCPGSSGAGPGAGNGGHGGGAIWILAGTAIDVGGSIFAPGAGGDNGGLGPSGGCGGGAGGLVGLDAPTVKITGQVDANGGGGAGGGGNVNEGADGGDSMSAIFAAAGTPGSPDGGGPGGSGSVGMTIGQPGAQATTSNGGGGGGGGGAGYVKIISTSPTISGAVSPNPS
ncbi:MAG TPA: hypothetical protein VGG74_36170 [Kofleriaceae bacterium]|jgi:hypothetical protein